MLTFIVIKNAQKNYFLFVYEIYISKITQFTLKLQEKKFKAINLNKLCSKLYSIFFRTIQPFHIL